MGRVAELGCALCRHLGFDGTPAEVHHIRDGQGAAQRKRLSDRAALPSITGAGLDCTVLEPRRFERTYKLSELDLFAATVEARKMNDNRVTAVRADFAAFVSGRLDQKRRYRP